ncbi:MAG: nuclear transport factor 2 family protein [Mucilaginibacter sp.]|nr:nuclear transport factor 2 family protein [Mucilaginibacter sp.]
MKTLRAMAMGLALLLVCGVSQAASITSHGNSTKDEVIDIYLNAVVHGKLNGISEAIDDYAQFDMKRGNSVNTLSKSQILKALKSGENIEQDCQCTKTVLQSDDEKSVVKVDMKYNDFTRTDVITAQRAGNGWQITKVETSYK